MNDFKKALIDVAGDLSDSERNVKRALQGKNKRPSKYNFLVAPVFIMALCLLGFSLWLIPGKLEQQATIFKQDALFDYYKAVEQLYGFEVHEENEQQVTTAAFERYKNALAIQVYAKAQSLTYTKQQYEKNKQYLDDINHHKDNPFYAKMFTVSNLTEKQYEQQVVPILIENQIYADLFIEKFVADNPKLLPEFARFYTNHVANRYLEQHFARDLQQAEEKYKIAPSYEGFGSSKSGTIAAIDGMLIYFIQNATYEEIQKMTAEELVTLGEGRLKAWLINDDQVDVQVGDFVRVSVNSTQTSYDAQLTNGMADHLEVVIPVEALALPRIDLPESALLDWQYYMEKAHWQSPFAVTNYLTPQYIVQVEDELYTIFSNDYNNVFIVPYKEQTIGKLTKGQSEKMITLLQQFVPK